MHIVAPPCRSAAKLLHRVATEAESTLRRRNILLEGELACSAIHFRSDVVVIVLIIGEVFVDDVISLLVNLDVVVDLQVVNLLHATAFLNEQRIAVDAIRVIGPLKVANLEDILEAVERYLNDLVIHAGQQVTKRLDAALADEVLNLLGLVETTRGGIRESPACLFLGLEIGVGEDVNQWRGDVGVNDRLDLRGIAGSDVGDSPAGLLADTVLGAREKAEEGGKGTTVDDDLGLNIVTSDDVADRAESRRLDRGGRVHQQFNEATAHARLNDSLNLLVGAIG
ncbi:hypothetical protein BC938DRAFT_474959 [Jimgerdemannia flammicorona]|uniref:Uncharacterized protein n=1 Tax=Jimgerdemannia flammicorona TaxID=994334 RepID=A0A433Q1B4_9FUNG|nr:hypothetical protein BC938DRAFT_474959 [Jimgerdemannia flammicorona]